MVRLTLVVNPRTDASFDRFVRDVFDDRSSDDPEELQERLRDRFPEAVVRVRLLANEAATVWYVYRDGHWTPSN